MTTLIDILRYILQTFTTLFLTFVILRFMLQLARADFYNPFSQATVKITNPLLIPLRKLIPGIFGIDVAAIVLCLLVQVAYGEIIHLLYTQTLTNPIPFFVWGLISSIYLTTYICWLSLIVIVICSFIAPYSQHPALVLIRQLMQPIIQPFQKLIPPMGGLDFSVLFVFMAVVVVQKILMAVAISIELNPFFVIGFF